MMTREQVIKALECRKKARKRCGNPCEEIGGCIYAKSVNDGNGIYLPYYCDIEQICEDAFTLLLKEQEAKQIVKRQVMHECGDGSIEYFSEWVCPHCNSLLKKGFPATFIQYCYQCGKAVKWE